MFALLPLMLQRKIRGPTNTLLVRIIPEGMEVLWVNNEDHIMLGIFSLDDDGRSGFFKKISERDGVQSAKCLLILSDDQYIKRNILLPKEAASNIREVIGFELDRYTPFSTETAYFDVLRNVLPIGNNKISVNLAVTSRVLLDGFLKDISGFQLRPFKATFSGTLSWPLDGEEFNLLPVEKRPTVGKKEPLTICMLVFLLLLEVTFAFTYPGYKAKLEVSALQQQITLIQKDVRRVSDMRVSIDQAQTQVKTFLGLAANKPFTVDVMKQLAEQLPLNTWLTQLQLTGNRLNIQGYSENAASLIQLIDNSPLFKNTRFTSPLANNKARQQAFKIGLNVVDRQE